MSYITIFTLAFIVSLFTPILTAKIILGTITLLMWIVTLFVIYFD